MSHYLSQQYIAFQEIQKKNLDSLEDISNVLSMAFFGEKKFTRKIDASPDTLEEQLAKHLKVQLRKESEHPDNLKLIQDAAQKFINKFNPKPKFSRILSTYNLKALLAAAAIYGSFIVGLTPFGLFLEGAAAFFFTKFMASHFLACKSEHKAFTSLYNQHDDTLIKKIKAIFYNGFMNSIHFLKETTYVAASKGMLDSTLIRNRSSNGKLMSQLRGYLNIGLYNSEFTAGNLDIRSLVIDLVAAIGSLLALIYAPIVTPLYRILTAVVPMVSLSSLGGYAIQCYQAKDPLLSDAITKSCLKIHFDLNLTSKERLQLLKKKVIEDLDALFAQTTLIDRLRSDINSLRNSQYLERKGDEMVIKTGAGKAGKDALKVFREKTDAITTVSQFLQDVSKKRHHSLIIYLANSHQWVNELSQSEDDISSYSVFSLEEDLTALESRLRKISEGLSEQQTRVSTLNVELESLKANERPEIPDNEAKIKTGAGDAEMDALNNYKTKNIEYLEAVRVLNGLKKDSISLQIQYYNKLRDIKKTSENTGDVRDGPQACHVMI